MTVGKIKQVSFSEGTAVTGAVDVGVPAVGLSVYASEAAFVSANGTATDGDAFYDSTDDAVKVYVNGTWRTQANTTETQTLSGKTLTAPTVGNYMRFTEGSAADTPSAGNVALYAKTDGLLYSKDDAGVETALGGGGSGSGELNLCENPIWATSEAGWTEGTNHGGTRITSGSPLDGVVSTAVQIEGNASTAESSTSGYYYTTDTVPSALRSKKLKVEFYCIVPSSDVWRLSVRLGGTRLDLSTDSSGVTTLPAGFTGKYTAYFDTTTAASALTIHFTKTTYSDTHDLVVTNVVVGPGTQPQGAVVSEWTSYTPTLKGSSNGSTFTNQTTTGMYRRVGDTLEFNVRTAFTGAPATGTGSFLWTLPAGLTIDSTKLIGDRPNGAVAIFNATEDPDSGLVGQGLPVYVETSGFRINYLEGGTTGDYLSASHPEAWQNGDFIKAVGSFPIAEWAGSGTVNLAQNDVEYAYNTDTSDATDTTDFGYGPGGVAIGSYTAVRSKRVRFQTAILPTDQLTLQVQASSTARWIDIENATYVNGLGNLHWQNANTYGLGLSAAAIADTTDIDVVFGIYAYASGATYGAAGAAWSGFTGYKWRVKKTSGGAAVGFGQVAQSSSGLVKSAGQLLGTNTSDSAATGYVGEYVENNRSSSTANLTTATYTSIDTGMVTFNDGNEVGITLTAGDWDISGSAYFIGAAGTTGSNFELFIGTAKGTATTGLVLSKNYKQVTASFPAPVRVALTTPVWRVSISATTTYYLKAAATFATSTMAAQGNIRARRVR